MDSKTINEQDCRAIETMVLSGVDLEALYCLFPGFDRDALTAVYESVKAVHDGQGEAAERKLNCS